MDVVHKEVAVHEVVIHGTVIHETVAQVIVALNDVADLDNLIRRLIKEPHRGAFLIQKKR